MSEEINISNYDIFKFMKEFDRRYGVVPNSGFLAGYYKISIHRVNNRLRRMEKDGMIERMGKGERKTTYEIK